MGNAVATSGFSRLSALAAVPLSLPGQARSSLRAEGEHEKSETGIEGCPECIRKAARVFCGGEHTLLRDPDTLRLYQLGACGLGFDHEKADRSGHSYVREVPLPAPAAAVFPGYYHNFVKVVGGRCYAYGCGRQAPNDGQLLIGSLEEETLPVNTQMRFAEAAAGGHHTLCRTRDGEVWASGAGWQGQMGNGSLTYKNPSPQRVPGLPRVQQLATGYYHSAARAEDGEWYVWGCNEQHQLAQDAAGAQVKQPKRLSSLCPELQGARIANVDGGYGHTLLLLEGGRLYSLGNHSEGQRALDPEAEEVPAVTEVQGLPGPVDTMAAGSHHSLAVVAGRVYGFGSDEFGQARGLGEPAEDGEQRASSPKEILGLPKDDPVVRVSAGHCHSAAQTASGRVFLWGCGGNGQLGDETLPDSSAVREVYLADILKRCNAE